MPIDYNGPVKIAAVGGALVGATIVLAGLASLGGALGSGVADSGGQKTSAGASPDGSGSSNDGITPLASGLGSGTQEGAGVGSAQFWPMTGPHLRPNGLKPLL